MFKLLPGLSYVGSSHNNHTGKNAKFQSKEVQGGQGVLFNMRIIENNEQFMPHCILHLAQNSVPGTAPAKRKKLNNPYPVVLPVTGLKVHLARTLSISGLKSRVLKLSFLILKMMVNRRSRIYFEIHRAPSEIPAKLPGQIGHSGQIFLHWVAATLKGLGEFQNKKSRPLFTIIFKKKMVISSLKILIHL